MGRVMGRGSVVRALTRRTVTRRVLRLATADLIGRAAGTVLAVALVAVAVDRYGLWAGLALVAVAVAGPVVAGVLVDLVPLWRRARRVAAARARAAGRPAGPEWPSREVVGPQIRRVGCGRDGGDR